MCIYYTDRTSLHYIAREHIFPAAIGGIRKLPKGYVSDEFNNDISKLELDFFRNSLIATARQMEGPGKKGSMSEQYATKSRVHVIADSKTQQVTGLGYIKLGKTTEIPNVKINVETGELTISFDKMAELEPKDNIKLFSKKCLESHKLNVRTILDDRLDQNILLFGIEEGIETRFNTFFVRNPANTMELTTEYIQKIGKSLHAIKDEPQSQKYWPSSRQTVKFDEEHFRVYGKIAFNFLASLKGSAYVKSPHFNAARNWIAYGGDNEFAQLDNSPVLFKGLPITNSQSIHYVMLAKVKKTLIASLSFYGALKSIVLLARDYNEPFESTGLICDWKNQREYDIMEYLGKLQHVVPTDY